MSPPTESIDDFPLEDLRRLVSTLVAEVGRLQVQLEDQRGEMQAVVAAKDGEIGELKAEVRDLKAKVAEQADEIARLKGLPARPKFKGRPSGMEQATSKPLGKKGRKRGRGSKVDKLAVTSQVKLKAQAPPGSRFRGYEDVLVQDLRISVEVVCYRRERWETPDGRRIVAALTSGILGGFAPELRRFIAASHFQGQVTSERL